MGVGQNWGSLESNRVKGEEVGALGAPPPGAGWGPDTWGSEPEEVAVRILSSDLRSFIFHFHSFVKPPWETVNCGRSSGQTRRESLSLRRLHLRGGRPAENGIKT